MLCASVFFYLKTATLASLKANKVMGKRSTVLEFIDEEVNKTDEALEFGSLSGPENEQIGPDLSKFTLLEATYGIGECECSAKT